MSEEIKDKPKAKAEGQVKANYELWAKECNTPKWMLAGTKVFFKWPDGFEMTKDDFASAIDTACNQRIG